MLIALCVVPPAQAADDVSPSAQKVAGLFGDLVGVTAEGGGNDVWVLDVYARIFRVVCSERELQQFDDVLTRAGEVTKLEGMTRDADGKLTPEDRTAYLTEARRQGLNALAPRLLEVQTAFVSFLATLDNQAHPTKPTPEQLDQFVDYLKKELPAIRRQVQQKLSGQGK